MFKYTLFLLLSLILLFSNCKNTIDETSAESPQAQRDIGGLKMTRGLVHKSEAATDGYVLFCPLLSSTTYLINLDGEVVRTWESDFGPSGWLYLQENGHLFRGGRDPQAPVFGGGGQGGWLEEFNWEGDLVWQYRFANEQHLAHHDVAIMPNGNILVLAWESRTPEEAVQAGRKPDLIPKAGVWPDMIVEIKPSGENGGEIIWEWHMWDHLIQDFDDSKDNYGIVADHPELVDINKSDPLPPPITAEELEERKKSNNATTNSTIDNRGSDIHHINSIDYNPELDQIILGSPDLHEIFIIDHSTTTAEAAGHVGGRLGKGGDLLYRWGNPQNYNRGDSTDQKLGGQHDAKWIPDGYPGAGNIMVFNNFVNSAQGGYSTVLELNPPLSDEGYLLTDNRSYGPDDPVWKYMAADTHSFFAPFISGAHRMSNGNTFITQGPAGRYFEVTPAGEILWDYLTPYAGYVKMQDGTFPQPVGPLLYATFRATHIPIDHPAVRGKALNPLESQPEIFNPPQTENQ